MVAILALAVAAVLCGYDNLTAISQRGREHGEALLAPLGFRHFPGPCVATLHRVFRIERHITDKQTGRTTCDTDFGITSLSAERADAQRLANLVRVHWGIENRLHWVRDVTFNEDASHVRSDHAPQTMAALCHVAISLIRLLDCDGIAPTLRHFAVHPAKAVAVLALSPSSFRQLKMK